MGTYNFQQVTSGIIIPILVVVAGLAAYFLLLPKYQDIRQQQRLLKAEEQKLQSNKFVFDDLKNLIAELEEKRESLSAVDKSIPASPEIPELLANLDFLANQSGLTFTSLQLSQAESIETAAEGLEVEQFGRQVMLQNNTEGLGIMQIDLKMIGGYSGLKNFLLNLEQNQRLMDIQEMTFEELDDESGPQ